MGAFDIVREVVGSAGETWFGSVAIQPGGPQGVGTWKRADNSKVTIVSLPGNPVATFVSFHLIVTPALAKARGIPTEAKLNSRPNLIGLAGDSFPRPKSSDLVIPARVSWGAKGLVAYPFNSTGKGSHFVASLNGIGGLVVLEKTVLAQ